MNATDPVTLAREVLAAEERHDGTPAHEAELREERWEFYEDLCTSGAPTLARAVERMAELADQLDRRAAWERGAPAGAMTVTASPYADGLEEAAARIRAALNGETHA